MANRGSKTLLAFGDVHVPHHHPVGTEVLCRYLGRRCILPDGREIHV